MYWGLCEIITNIYRMLNLARLPVEKWTEDRLFTIMLSTHGTKQNAQTIEYSEGCKVKRDTTRDTTRAYTINLQVNQTSECEFSSHPIRLYAAANDWHLISSADRRR